MSEATKLWKVTMTVEVEAADEDEAIHAANRIDATSIVESVVEILTPEVNDE